MTMTTEAIERLADNHEAADKVEEEHIEEIVTQVIGLYFDYEQSDRNHLPGGTPRATVVGSSKLIPGIPAIRSDMMWQ